MGDTLTSQVASSPFLLQLLILISLVLFFFVGQYFRALWDRNRLTARQMIGGGGIVFITMALPLCEVIYQSVAAGATLFAFLSSCVPTFTFGVATKEHMGSLIPQQDGQAAT